MYVQLLRVTAPDASAGEAKPIGCWSAVEVPVSDGMVVTGGSVHINIQ